MPSQEALDHLLHGSQDWNQWRWNNPQIEQPDLRGADLSGINLNNAFLVRADLSGAVCHGAKMLGADMREANLSRSDMRGANLSWATLYGANLDQACLQDAILRGSDFRKSTLRGANLNGAFLRDANLRDADLADATIRFGNLINTSLVETHLERAVLDGCCVYGASVWRPYLENTSQQNLVITPEDESQITVDNLEVAQFVHLLVHNEKIRGVIDTVGRKAVLILGRFTPERKRVLDDLRNELRHRDYLPIVFDFDIPADRDITETVSLLAHMARFVIADLTDPSSIPKELEAFVPGLAVPVQPLLEGLTRPYSMFTDYWKYDWVLPPYRYEGLEALRIALAEKVIAPAEAKVRALLERRRGIESDLTGSAKSAS